jgi:hypothetical protein
MVPAIAGLGILAIGSIMTVASSLLRTGERTIPIATITQTADKSLGKTAATLKQSGRSTHQYKRLMRAGLIDKTVPNCTCASAHSGGMWYTRIAKSNGATFLSSALRLSLPLRFLSIWKMGMPTVSRQAWKTDYIITAGINLSKSSGK